ncbi:hypothetical protein [Methylobacterium bullatum]|uniref:Serine-threonine protein kinase n=1 Tax=Methylobacterium bullatum TaxID=570505 RepID=A0A679K279_9HYPH|nr:hypothetical protein MBLL_04284 [Methylobacterium bullatum]
MDKLGSSPFTWCEFDAMGNVLNGGAERIMDLVQKADAQDLVVVSHGWKNERPDAQKLYSELWLHTVAALRRIPPERIIVCGIMWPATQYRTAMDEDAFSQPDGGGAASVHGAGPVRDLTDEELEEVLKDNKDLFSASATALLDAARATAEGITGARAQSLVEAAKPLMSVNGIDDELIQDVNPYLNAEDYQLFVSVLVDPPSRGVQGTVGGVQGLGDAAGQRLAGPRAAVARFLNQLTYFEMKRRAGVVGAGLASSVLSKLDPGERKLRLHLVGHSFGARLVTAAAAALPPTVRVDFFSLTLLQGAFSHNALARSFGAGLTGAFSDVVGRPSGPIAMTYTHNDLACTLAYALASRLSWDMATSIGDANDPFGAMGANGAQHLADGDLAPAATMGTAAGDQRDRFKLVCGKVNGFRADDFVVQTDTTDAHNNVANPTVGLLLAAVIEAGPGVP